MPLTKTKYIIGAVNKATGVVSLYTTGTPAVPVEYATLAAAETQATTLANQNPSNKYAVMLATKIATSATTWE